MNKDIKYLVERLFDDDSDLLDSDELTLDDLNIADNLEYIDLGLPSGTLWCKHNVGAKQPEEYGNYFNWEDANEKYTLPSKKLTAELENNCKWDWITINNINGFKITGPNNNSIFLPAAGGYYFSTERFFSSPEFCGDYWTSDGSGKQWIYSLCFTRLNISTSVPQRSKHRFTVRQVTKNRYKNSHE